MASTEVKLVPSETIYEPSTESSKKGILICGILFLLVGIIAFTISIILWMDTSSEELHGRYGIVFDVGGSGTRMYLYEYQHARRMNERLSVKCEDKGATNQNIDDLKKFILKCLKRVEEELSNGGGDAPIFMAASGGMRVLQATDIKRYNDVWKVLRGVLQNGSLPVKFADTLTGKMEGAYSWTTVNTLLDKKMNSGIFELGSTSFQIAFDSSNTYKPLQKNHTIEVNLNDKKIDIHSQSYLCYGLGEIISRYRAMLVTTQNSTSIIEDPCSFIGDNRNISNEYFNHSHCIKGNLADEIFGSSITLPSNDSSRVYTFRGKGNFDACLINLNITLSKGLHTRQHHPLTHGLFTAIGGGTYYSSEFLKLPERSTLQDYKEATKRLCKKTYTQVKNSPGYSKFAFQYCLADSYSYLLFHDVLNLDNQASKISFVNKISKTKVGWPLGLMVNNVNQMSLPVISTKRYISKALFIVLLVLSILIITIGIISIVTTCTRGLKKGRMFLSPSKTNGIA